MWFRYRLRYRPNVLPIWVSVSVSDLNQNSGFGRTLLTYYPEHLLFRGEMLRIMIRQISLRMEKLSEIVMNNICKYVPA